MHGLGLLQRDHNLQVNTIIDAFLAANPDIDARLIRYANSAPAAACFRPNFVLKPSRGAKLCKPVFLEPTKYPGHKRSHGNCDNKAHHQRQMQIRPF